ncbi:MAG TPA: UbiA family prenyltransferase [Gemmataceae bacterium]|nr:UbiA family prenyltransferase [Gemmataceae bacterium]
MRFLNYARLLRLPNVFTAFADILLGTIAAATWQSHPFGAAALLLASGCLYCAGMVWNDYFDFEVDKRERPFRPLPAGQISRTAAIRLGSILLAVGVALALAAGFTSGSYLVWPGVFAALIAIAVLLYDGWLKRTFLGPVAMATCRFLNVLLALSLATTTEAPWLLRLHLAGIVGLYIVGVTWFARQEAGRSHPAHLVGAAIFVAITLALALVLPVYRPPGSVIPAFPYLLVAFGFYLGLPAYRAIRQPEPKHVQAVVKRAILGLMLLDAILCTAEAGWSGLLIILLLPPALLLGKWVYST